MTTDEVENGIMFTRHNFHLLKPACVIGSLLFDEDLPARLDEALRIVRAHSEAREYLENSPRTVVAVVDLLAILDREYKA
jgi:hypothetical protein